MFKSGQTSVDTDMSGRPSRSANEQNMKRAQAMILENRRVTTAETAAKLGNCVARPWCKSLLK